MNNLLYNNEYYQRTYAGWLAKIIGIRIGSPIEGLLHEDIIKKHGEIDRYVANYDDYAADDDSNGPLFFIRSLYDFIDNKENITFDNMSETWLNYVADGHGFFWWGGYGISTENTAYDNLKYGIKSPQSGSIKQNGMTCSQQIGGQIFVDTWGFVFPGNPKKAAQYAQKMISVSHDKEAIHGGMFIAACISGAYISSSINEIINYGLSVIPKDCHYAYLVNSIIDFYNKDSEKNWYNGFKFIQENFGYDKYPGNCHIIPNAAIIILSLLYGNSDFSLSQKICNTCGWDTDCNAGNLGSILGVYLGIEKIDDYWISPIKDIILSSSAIGYLNIDTISNSAKFFCDLGCKYANKEIPEKWNDRYFDKEKIFCFDMEKSTQGFRCDNNTSIINSSHAVLKNHRSLELVNNNDNTIETYIKTYYSPEDLEDSRYDPSFSPIIYPGQEIEVLFQNRNEYPIKATIFYEDKHDNKKYYSVFETIEAHAIKKMETRIPNDTDYLISKIGITVKNNFSSPKEMKINIDNLMILGQPNYKIDFAKEKIENYGFSQGKLHLEVRGFTFSNGSWELEDNNLVGSCNDKGEILFGYYYTKDLIYKSNVNLITGDCAYIDFCVQGLARSYSFGFSSKNKIALIKKKVKQKILIEKNFEYETNETYELKIVKNSNKINCYINDILVIDYIDLESPYTYGQQGMSVQKTSRAQFNNISINSIN